MDYTASYYNFQVARPDGTLLLYNTRTGGLIFINENAMKIKAILDEPDLYKKTNDFKPLYSNGFIVPKDLNETQEVARKFMLTNTTKSNLAITILPTEYCNFSCPYCFVVEDGKSVTMSAEIYSSIFEFICQHVENHFDNTTVTIGWFGGEPMLCIEDIENFMHRLIDLEKKYAHVTLRSKIVTNGFLLNYDAFLRLYNVKVRNFQITLDGAKENHDQLRMLKNGKPTFDIIYRNLIDIKDICTYTDFSVSLRGNFLRSNIESMKQLAEQIIADFKGDERFDLSFRPVVDFTTKKDAKGVDQRDYCGKQEAVRIQEELARHMQGKENTGNRMFSTLPYPVNKWCNVNKQTSFIFDTNGFVFACDSVISDKNEAIGIIQADGTIKYNDKAAMWRNNIFQSDKYPKCQACKMLPVCLGGCTRQRLIHGKGICTWTPEMIIDSMMHYNVSV